MAFGCWTNSRCEVQSSVFTLPGDVSPIAEYDVGKLLDLHVNLKQLSLNYNCLLKMEPVVFHLPNLSSDENITELTRRSVEH